MTQTNTIEHTPILTHKVYHVKGPLILLDRKFFELTLQISFRNGKKSRPTMFIHVGSAQVLAFTAHPLSNMKLSDLQHLLYEVGFVYDDVTQSFFYMGDEWGSVKLVSQMVELILKSRALSKATVCPTYNAYALIDPVKIFDAVVKFNNN